MLEMHTNEATHKSSPFLKIKIHKKFSSLLEWVFTKCKCVRRVNTNWLQDSDQIFWTIGEERLTPIRGGEQHSPWWHRTRAPTSWLAGSHKGHIKASAPPHRAQSPGCCWRPSSSCSPSPPPPPQTPGLRQYFTDPRWYLIDVDFSSHSVLFPNSLQQVIAVQCWGPCAGQCHQADSLPDTSTLVQIG